MQKQSRDAVLGQGGEGDVSKQSGDAVSGKGGGSKCVR